MTFIALGPSEATPAKIPLSSLSRPIGRRCRMRRGARPPPSPRSLPCAIGAIMAPWIPKRCEPSRSWRDLAQSAEAQPPVATAWSGLAPRAPSANLQSTSTPLPTSSNAAPRISARAADPCPNRTISSAAFSAADRNPQGRDPAQPELGRSGAASAAQIERRCPLQRASSLIIAIESTPAPQAARTGGLRFITGSRPARSADFRSMRP